MQRGEIYLAAFPFGDVAGMKLRPVLLLTAPVGAGNEVIVAYISSVVPGTLLASDILLDPAQQQYRMTRLKRLRAASAQARNNSPVERAALSG